jgi:prophage tail gpP-like protein
MVQELVTLRVDGRTWEGWESVKMDDIFGKTLCSRIDLVLSDRYRGDFNARPIELGMKYECLLGDELRQTGWINKVGPGYGPTRHGIKISGRDLTQDLVDCSSTVTPGSWTNRKLEDIAKDLCAEFSVPVVPGDDTGKPIAQAALQVGDTPFQFLEKLCRTRNVWLASTAEGALTFVKASTERLDGVLIRGDDIEEADADYSDEGRFSDYYGKGQQRGSDQVSDQEAAVVSGHVSDPSIARHRPLVIQGEDQQNGETLGDRLLNERNKRIGDSQSIKIKVAGWRMKNGLVWPTNRRVAVTDDWLLVDGVYTIEQCSFSLGKNDNSTMLTLVPPEKFDITSSGGAGGAPAYSSRPDPSDPFPGVS